MPLPGDTHDYPLITLEVQLELLGPGASVTMDKDHKPPLSGVECGHMAAGIITLLFVKAGVPLSNTILVPLPHAHTR